MIAYRTFLYGRILRAKAFGMKRSLILLLALLLTLSGAAARRDPETGRIRILYVGDMIRPSPYPVFEAEPLIDVRVAWPVGGDLTQGSIPIAQKLLRQYIPRTYDALADNDGIIIDNPDVTIFDPKYLVWFRDAVMQDGSGFFMVGGNAAFGGRPNPSWGPTPIQDVLPVWVVDQGWLEYGSLEILEKDHEFVASLPLDRRWEWVDALGGNEVTVKEGAQLLAQYHGPLRVWSNPFWVTWEVGEGRSFAQTVDWTPGGGWLLIRWPYYSDYAVNLMFYITRNPIPEETELMHKLRGMYVEYRSMKAYVYSIIDFAEKLGANMGSVDAVIIEADEKQGESVESYLQYEFTQADGLITASVEDLGRAVELAFKLKDQAMMWIFLIEWSAVTATLAGGGFVLWTLMVRRRLYRQVQHTRFG